MFSVYGGTNWRWQWKLKLTNKPHDWEERKHFRNMSEVVTWQREPWGCVDKCHLPHLGRLVGGWVVLSAHAVVAFLLGQHKLQKHRCVVEVWLVCASPNSSKLTFSWFAFHPIGKSHRRSSAQHRGQGVQGVIGPPVFISCFAQWTCC